MHEVNICSSHAIFHDMISLLIVLDLAAVYQGLWTALICHFYRLGFVLLTLAIISSPLSLSPRADWTMVCGEAERESDPDLGGLVKYPYYPTLLEAPPLDIDVPESFLVQ